MNDIRRRQDDEARKAQADLARAGREGEFVGNALRQAADHFTARDAAQTDPAELWAKRIARVAAAIFVVFLLWWLVRHLTR
jgi:hypothetical protein